MKRKRVGMWYSPACGNCGDCLSCELVLMRQRTCERKAAAKRGLSWEQWRLRNIDAALARAKAAT